jgi:SAM-dependent methyltransferase
MQRAIAARFSWWIKRGCGMAFDFIHSVDTKAGRPAPACDIVSPNRDSAVPYDPAPWRSLRRSLQLASLRPDEFTFIDIGCGKGKVLLAALALPFKRIIGIEFSPFLCQIARNNLASARLIRRRCAQIQVSCSDAVEYPIPNEPTIFFFYNPFTYDVMEIVLGNIVGAQLRTPCPRYLIFYAASSNIDRIKVFLQKNSDNRVRLFVSSHLGKRSVYIFELLDRR